MGLSTVGAPANDKPLENHDRLRIESSGLHVSRCFLTLRLLVVGFSIEVEGFDIRPVDVVQLFFKL